MYFRLTLASALFAASLFAQSSTGTATMIGAITDTTGSVVPGAKVTVTNKDAGFVFTSVSTSEGTWYIPNLNPGNYQLLVNEVCKVSHDVEQAGKIAESIETATEDIFRDFDLSTFMEHFKLDALEKTILALAVKAGSRIDLKTKGELKIRILSAHRS